MPSRITFAVATWTGQRWPFCVSSHTKQRICLSISFRFGGNFYQYRSRCTAARLHRSHHETFCSRGWNGTRNSRTWFKGLSCECKHHFVCFIVNLKSIVLFEITSSNLMSRTMSPTRTTNHSLLNSFTRRHWNERSSLKNYNRSRCRSNKQHWQKTQRHRSVASRCTVTWSTYYKRVYCLSMFLFFFFSISPIFNWI